MTRIVSAVLALMAGSVTGALATSGSRNGAGRAASPRRAEEREKQVDVVIVGAGWAGMAAAAHLARHSPNVSFVVLESTNRTGGRTEAIEFGRGVDAGGPGRYVVEVGSNWISGVTEPGGTHVCSTEDGSCPDVRVNSIYEMALRSGIHMSTGEVGEFLTGTVNEIPMVFDAQGRNGDPSGEVMNRFSAAVRCLARKGKESLLDGSDTVREVLESCGWTPKSEVEWAIDVGSTECSGAENDMEVATSWAFDDIYDWWGHGDALVVDQNPRGYAQILDEMVKDVVPPSDPRIVFDAHVVQIDYSQNQCMDPSGNNSTQVFSVGSRIVVTTRDGRNFHGNQVISTLPIGVLKQHHSRLFLPPLPIEMSNALSGEDVVMRNVTRIVLQFPVVWWNNSLPRWVSANKGANDTASADIFTRWRNMNHEHAIPGSNIIFTFLGDPMSSFYEGLPNDEVKVAVMEQLRSQHPAVSIPDPVDFYVTRHGYDETRLGAFSSFRSDAEEFYSSFERGVKSSDGITRIRFAGEAMCYDLSGYTHGGLYSGIGVAAKYLYEHGLGPDPSEVDDLDLCNW